jgi:flagellin-like hook-associated protein FlgL
MTTEKTAAEVWDEAVEATAKHLEEDVIHYTWNGRPRRPSNYRAAAADARTTPNPYRGNDAALARTSAAWLHLSDAAAKLGAAAAEFDIARQNYLDTNPYETKVSE